MVQESLIFSYGPQDRSLKLSKPLYSLKPNLSIGDEYIKFDTCQEAFKFIVDDRIKELKIQRASFSNQKIPLTLTFQLWNPYYTDIILPGKVEIIHRDTLVRSVGYKRSKNIQDKYFISNERDLIAFCKILAKNNPLIPNVTYEVEYHKTALIDACILKVYALAKNRLGKNQRIYFIPTAKWDLSNRLEYTTIDMKSDMEFQVNLKDKENTWLVYSKLQKDYVFLVNGMNDACRLLAKLKFDDSTPFINCGVALFEDYYFMPLAYDYLKINTWTGDVLLHGLNQKIKDTQLKILKLFKG